MPEYNCGPCCFKKNFNKNERIEMSADVNKILSANPSVDLLCSDCDKEVFIIDGVITTKIPYEGYSNSDNNQDTRGFDLVEDISLQMDFFEIMRVKK